MKYVDKKGKQWCLQLHNKNIYDAEGHVVAADVVAHDITERKQAEEKLQQTLESLRKAFGATIQVYGIRCRDERSLYGRSSAQVCGPCRSHCHGDGITSGEN